MSRPRPASPSLLLAVGVAAAIALAGCSSGSGSSGSSPGSGSSSAASAGAGGSGPAGTAGTAGAGGPTTAADGGSPAGSAGAASAGAAAAAPPVATVPADRSGIVSGRTTDPGGRPVVVADPGTVTRAVQAVLKAAGGGPRTRLLGILGVGFTGGQGVLRVSLQEPADPATGVEYTVDTDGAVVGPRVVPQERLLKGFPAPATAERLTELGFTLDQAPLAGLDRTLAAAVAAAKIEGATVGSWNLTRERTGSGGIALQWLVDVAAGPKDATVTLGVDGSVVEVAAG